MKNITKEQLVAVACQAINDDTRAIATDGVFIGATEAAELGDSHLAWLRDRLDLTMTTDSLGVYFRPRSIEE